MNITSLGIGSGLQLESIVEAYINAAAIPQEIRLQEKEDSLNLELSGVGSFKSSLDTFNTILEKLTAENAFNKQSITASSEDITVKTNGFASNGVFSVEVQQLAKGSELKSASFTAPTDLVGNGTLTLTAGTNTFDVVIDAADDLSAVRDKINAQAENFGVTANIITSDSGTYLFYSSTISGAANNLTVTTSDASLDSISTNNTQTVAQQSTDAIITINGDTVTNDTNEFKNNIEDVTITAAKVNTGNPTTLTIAQDDESAAELINEFIAGYNTMIDDLKGLGAPKQGRLAFDPNVRQVRQSMATFAIDNISGLSGTLKSLADIGIDLDKEGHLGISTFTTSSIPTGQARLDDALSNHLSEVGEIFASTNGVATLMSSTIKEYIDTTGVLTQRVTTLNERITDVADEWTELEERLRSYEETLRKQFTALDKTVAGYNATSSWLSSTLENLLPKKD